MYLLYYIIYSLLILARCVLVVFGGEGSVDCCGSGCFSLLCYEIARKGTKNSIFGLLPWVRGFRYRRLTELKTLCPALLARADLPGWKDKKENPSFPCESNAAREIRPVCYNNLSFVFIIIHFDSPVKKSNDNYIYYIIREMIWWFFALLCGERLCILLSFQAIFFGFSG